MSTQIPVIVVIGPTGVGKSSFICDLAPQGPHHSIEVGHDLQSKTNTVQPVLWVNNDGRKVKLVDTPGFNDTRHGLNDVKVLRMIAEFLEAEYRGDSKLSGLIYMHRISDTRVAGTSRRSLRMFQKLCGQDSLKNAAIVTSMWDEVSPEEGAQREQELRADDNLFKLLLDEGAVMRRHDGTHESASQIVNYFLGKESTTTQIVHELVNERKILEETAAGIEIQSEVHTPSESVSTVEKTGSTIQHMAMKAAERRQAQEVRLKLTELQESKRNGHSANEVRGISSAGPRGGPDIHTYTTIGEGGRYSPLPLYQTADASNLHPRQLSDTDVTSRPAETPVKVEKSRHFPANAFPAPQTTCVVGYVKLLHFVKLSESNPAVANHNVSTSLVSRALDVANTLESGVKSAQRAWEISKSILGSESASTTNLQQQLRELQDALMFTRRGWANAQSSVVIGSSEAEAALLSPTRMRLLIFGTGRGRVDSILNTIVETIRAIASDMRIMVDWWNTVIDAISDLEDAAGHTLGTGGPAFDDDSVKTLLRNIIRALDLYCGAYETSADELRHAARRRV